MFLLPLFTQRPLPSPSISLKTSGCTCSGFQHKVFALFALLFMANVSFACSLASLNNVWRNAFLRAYREANRIHKMKYSMVDVSGAAYVTYRATVMMCRRGHLGSLWVH